MLRGNILDNDRDYIRRALYMMIAWDCGRYCLVTYRGESAEKGDIHWRISSRIASLIWGDKTHYVLKLDNEAVYGRCDIHKFLADGLTDRMDEVLGMPIGGNGYFHADDWGDKMFNWIWDHWDEMKSLEPEY